MEKGKKQDDGNDVGMEVEEMEKARIKRGEKEGGQGDDRGLWGREFGRKREREREDGSVGREGEAAAKSGQGTDRKE